MRVLLVNAHGGDTSVGGAEHHVARLASILAERGAEVLCLAAYPHRAPAGLPTVTLRNRGPDHPATRATSHLGDLLTLRRRLRQAVRAADPDLVHTHNLPGIGTGLWAAAREENVPVVHTTHDYYLLCPRVTLMARDGSPCCQHRAYCATRRHRLARWSSGVGDVVSVSRHTLDRHRQLFPSARHHVLRNPAPKLAQGSAAPPHALRTLGYLGSLENEKGVRVLLDAAPTLAASGLRLAIAGDGRLRDLAIDAARQLEAVEFVGQVDGKQKRSFIDGCDMGIIPSVWEEPGGPTYALLEWLAARRPVLCSTRGGLGESLPELGGAVPIEPTVEGIVAALTDLRSDERFSALARKARPVAAAHDEHAWAERYEAVYRDALSGR